MFTMFTTRDMVSSIDIMSVLVIYSHSEHSVQHQILYHTAPAQTCAHRAPENKEWSSRSYSDTAAAKSRSLDAFHSETETA